MGNPTASTTRTESTTTPPPPQADAVLAWLLGDEPIDVLMTIFAHRACVHCGDTQGTSDHPAYVGGRGYILQRLCDDAVACWRRYDRAHGLA